MMKVLDIGKFLNVLFKGMEINIYPVIAENGTRFPYAVYWRESTVHEHKDRSISAATYEIDIVSEQYNESIMLLQKFLDECRQLQTFENNTVRINVVSSSESYNDAYIQSVIIEIEIS